MTYESFEKWNQRDTTVRELKQQRLRAAIWLMRQSLDNACPEDARMLNDLAYISGLYDRDNETGKQSSRTNIAIESWLKSL